MKMTQFTNTIIDSLPTKFSTVFSKFSVALQYAYEVENSADFSLAAFKSPVVRLYGNRVGLRGNKEYIFLARGEASDRPPSSPRSDPLVAYANSSFGLWNLHVSEC